MKQPRIAILFLLSVLLATACTREDKATINKAVWTSSDPFNIPYKRRVNEMNAGNLLLNPSFERGRYFNERLNTFELPGWTEIGSATKWVDINRLAFSDDQVSEGGHAIRIERPRVDELEKEGAGMLSDFIKVIAGNYRLEYSIRLEEIHPYKERWGSRLEDAVNIRIRYYDKNKIRIGGATINPVNGRRFDNEFQAMPFALYWQIDSLGWMRVQGVTNKFPYSNGDIPDETRYIRIYFGLKGPGTMWVDDVRFEFTRHNFTLYERLQQWQDRTFSPYDLLIPMPKQVSPAASLSLSGGPEQSGQPLILIDPEAPKVVQKAAEKLKKEMGKMLSASSPDDSHQVPILTQWKSQRLKEASLVFCLGENSLSRRYRSQLPYDSIEDKPEGYFIQSLEEMPNTIFVAGNTPIGNYYGMSTLIQLLDVDEGVYHHAQIIDYPDYKRRGVYCSPELDGLDFLVQHRYNRIYPKEGEGTNGASRSTIRSLGRQSLGGKLFTPGLSIDLYPRGSGCNQAFPPSGQATRQVLQKVGQSQSDHVKSLVLRMDGVFSHPDSCGQYTEVGSPPNGYTGLLEEQIKLIRKLADKYDQAMEISCLPVWNTSQCMIRSHGKGEMILGELFKRVPSGVNLLWSGPVAYPLNIDASELAYIEKTTGELPVFYCRDMNPFNQDVFLKAYPGKARMSSFFDHFIVELPSVMARGHQPGLLTRNAPDSMLARLGLMTLSEYLWNASDYDPDLSLLKVLIAKYGSDIAWDLIRLNEAYFGLAEMYGKIRSRETKVKYVRSAEDFKGELDAAMKRLQPALEGTPLFQELTYYKRRSEQYIQHIMSH
jgi:hypothetical protein